MDTSPYQAPQSLPPTQPPAKMPDIRELKFARVVLIIVGVLTLGYLAWQYSQYLKEIETLTRDLTEQGGSLEQLKAENPEAAQQLNLANLLFGAAGALGITFIVLGFLVPKFPFGAPLTGLILYLLDWGSLLILEPSMFAKGIIIKAIIVIALVRAVNAGAAYKRSLLRSRLY